MLREIKGAVPQLCAAGAVLISLPGAVQAGGSAEPGAPLAEQMKAALYPPIAHVLSAAVIGMLIGTALALLLGVGVRRVAGRRR